MGGLLTREKWVINARAASAAIMEGITPSHAVPHAITSGLTKKARCRR